MKGVEYGEYPPVPFAPFDAEADTLPPVEIPGPPRLPSEVAATLRPAPIDDLAMRVADLSDAIHDPGGLLHRLFQDAEERAAQRHEDAMRTLRDVANGVAALSAIIAKLVPEQERHAALLTLVKGPKRAGKKRAARAAE